MKPKNTIIKKLKESKEAQEWWVKNKDKVYDPDLEYPVLEELPMLNECINDREILFSNKIVSEEHIYKKYYKDIIEEIYYWNIGKKDTCVVELKLVPYELKIIEQKFIQKLSIKEIIKLNDTTDNYIYSLLSRIKKKVKVEYEQMLKYSGKNNG